MTPPPARRRGASPRATAPCPRPCRSSGRRSTAGRRDRRGGGAAASQAVTRHPSTNATSGTSTPSRSPKTVAARCPVADATADQPRSHTVPIAQAASPATTSTRGRDQRAAHRLERTRAHRHEGPAAEQRDREHDAGDAGAERRAREEQRRDRIVAAEADELDALRVAGVVADRAPCGRPTCRSRRRRTSRPGARRRDGRGSARSSTRPSSILTRSTRAVVRRQSIVDRWRQSIAPRPTRVSPVTVSGIAIASSAITATTGSTRSGSRATAQRRSVTRRATPTPRSHHARHRSMRLLIDGRPGRLYPHPACATQHRLSRRDGRTAAATAKRPRPGRCRTGGDRCRRRAGVGGCESDAGAHPHHAAARSAAPRNGHSPSSRSTTT